LDLFLQFARAAQPMTAASVPVECFHCKSVVVLRPNPARVHVIERVIERVVLQSASGPGTAAARLALQMIAGSIVWGTAAR
jgi:hypothetical protein